MIKFRHLSAAFVMATACAISAVAGTGFSAPVAYADSTGLIDIGDCDIALVSSFFSYSGEAITPEIKAVHEGTSMVKDVDYTLEYHDNVNAGNAYVTVNGIGNYTGSTRIDFVINKANTQIKYLETTVTKTYFDSDFINTLSQVYTDATIRYTSSNENIAGVNVVSGKVSIRGIGETIITASATGGNNYGDATVSYKLIVNKATPDVRFSQSVVTKTYGDSDFDFPVSVKKTDADVVYVSDNPDIAYVDDTTGRVTIKHAGTTTIWAIAIDGTYYKDTKTSYTIRIDKRKSKLEFKSANVNKTYGDGAFTNSLVTSDTDGSIVFSSSNPDIATVDLNTGRVDIKKAGQVKITARTVGCDNYTDEEASYTLNIAKAQPTISFRQKVVYKTFLDDDYTKSVDELISDEDAIYSSSNTNVAIVNSRTGTVTIVGAGEAVITAAVPESEKYLQGENSYTLYVDKAQAQLNFPGTEIVKKVGDPSFIRRVSVAHTDGDITYYSTDESVVRVDETTGLVTIVGAGEARIIAESAECDNYYWSSANYKIIVNKTFANVTFGVTNVTKTYGDAKFTIGFSRNTSDGDITYTSSNEKVAKVDPVTGEVTIVGTGNAVITAQVAESEKYYAKKATYNLVVQKAASKFILSMKKFYKEPNFVIDVDGLAIDGKITYSSSNKNIAVVNATTGVVSIKGVGTVYIYLDVDGGSNYAGSKLVYKITVTKAPNVVVATNFTKVASKKAQSFYVANLHVKSGVKPVFKSNSKYVTVDKNGKITIAKNFIGVAKITIVAPETNHYLSGKKVITITVNPAVNSITKVSNSKGKKMVIKWSKDTRVTGYEIKYTTDINFKKCVNRFTRSASTTSATVSRLAKNKTYYIQIRTYKTINGKKYYSKWSSIKAVKITK